MSKSDICIVTASTTVKDDWIQKVEKFSDIPNIHINDLAMSCKGLALRGRSRKYPGHNKSMIYNIIAFLLALQSETFYFWCQIRLERAILLILGGKKRNPAARSGLYFPLKRSVFGSHGIRTLKVVTSPLSRAHLTSSEAKFDRWRWN